jgi:transcriptional regulator with XRE-family HTH domain
VKTVAKTVAENVRTYRQLRGLDQDALARRMQSLGIPWRRVTVSEVERDQRNVTVAELPWLVLALGTTIEQLLDTRGPERMRGPGMVSLAPSPEWADLGREIRTEVDGREVVYHEVRQLAIFPENMTALVCTHKARAVAEWDDDGSLNSLHYEHEEQPR